MDDNVGFPPMPTLDAPTEWLRELRARYLAHWAFKAVVITSFITLFFVAYFHLLEHPRQPVTTIPLVAVDRWIPFQPWAFWPYVSLWFYVVLGPALLRGTREMAVYAQAVALLTLVGFAFFFLCPTAVPPAMIDWTKYAGMGLLKRVDASGNACPSLHVGFAVFTLIWLERLLRRLGAPRMVRLANIGWCFAIVYSTLATKQHVAIDALVGGELGALAGSLNPNPPGFDLRATYSPFSRQALAFAISLGAKAIILAVGLGTLGRPLTAGLFLLPDLWIVAGLVVPNHRGLIPTAIRFSTTKREVWLTIDDGPEPATTPAMLDLLERHRAKATFFVIGEKAAAHPELIAEIRRRGHTLGNHTQTHPLATFWLAGPGRTAREVNPCDSARMVDSLSDTPWFRPPAGIKTLFLRRCLAKRGQALIGWSARGFEAMTDGIETPLRLLTRRLAPGAILVVHESPTHAQARVALLSALLEHLSDSGYTCGLPQREDLR